MTPDLRKRYREKNRSAAMTPMTSHARCDSPGVSSSVTYIPINHGTVGGKTTTHLISNSAVDPSNPLLVLFRHLFQLHLSSGAFLHGGQRAQGHALGPRRYIPPLATLIAGH